MTTNPSRLAAAERREDDLAEASLRRSHFRRGLLRFVITVLVFVVVGPPLGGFALFLAMQPHFLLRGFLEAAMVAVASYHFGALPALAAGTLVGARQAFHHSVSAPVLVLVGLVAGIGFVLVEFGIRPADWMDRVAGAVIVACVFSTFVCRAIARACLHRLPSSTKIVS